MISLTLWSPMSWTYEDNINWSIPKPDRLDYLCDKCKISNNICNIRIMCSTGWNQYRTDVSDYLVLKFKDTYTNG